MSSTPSNTPTPRNGSITFRASKQDVKAIKAAAQQQGVSVSRYIFNKVTKP